MSLEKENNSMEKVLNFAYKDVKISIPNREGSLESPKINLNSMKENWNLQRGIGTQTRKTFCGRDMVISWNNKKDQLTTVL